MEQSIWLFDLLWIVAAAGLGFLIAALFAGWLQWPRRRFLVPYVGLTAIFLSAYALWSDLDVVALLAHNWLWGVLAGTLVGALMVANVRTQPASRQAAGGELLLDLAWLGAAYGFIDALFLNVMPVLAVWHGTEALGWTASWPGRIGAGALALAASLFVTFAYHVGYPEYRNRRVGLVLVGNSLITLAYVLSGNPLGAIISHVVMHLAAVIRGPETTIQLPPHLAAE